MLAFGCAAGKETESAERSVKRRIFEMANFFGKDGKQLTDEELEQASGGMVIATNTNIFTQKHWICPK